MKRQQWIVEHYGQRLLDRARNDIDFMSDGLSASDLVDHLMDVDPTSNKVYSTWLAAAYARGDLQWIEMSEVEYALAIFHRWRGHLPKDKRDIGRCKNFADLHGLVREFEGKTPSSGKKKDRRDRDAAYAETRIILDDDELLVVSPQTEKAAIWWGRGTKWCTSAESNSHFSKYHANGDLVILIEKKSGIKRQFHAWSKMICDEKDQKKEVSWWYFDFGPRLKAHAPALFTAMFPNDPEATCFGEACEIYGLSLTQVPLARINFEICEAALRRNKSRS